MPLSGFDPLAFFSYSLCMTDILSKKKRSQVMASIRSTGNKATELKLISIFRMNEITGWRRRQKLLGNPDFTFSNESLVVFVDGCFWHGCARHLRLPHSHKRYWRDKIANNKKRDLSVRRKLRQMGWRVLRLWEHELRDEARAASRVARAISESSKLKRIAR